MKKKRTILLIFFAGVFGVTPLLFAYRFSGKNIQEITEGPSVPYISDEESDEVMADCRRADLIFTAVIGNVVFADMGLPGPKMRNLRIYFKGMSPIKGGLPAGTGFNYLKPPASLELPQNMPVIAVLKKREKSSKEFTILRIVPAHDIFVRMAKEAARLAEPAEGDPETQGIQGSS